MCTALIYQTKDLYFGRNLDYDFSYGDEVTIVPRNHELNFRYMGKMKSHFAMIGMACVIEDVPLYYDAVNEKGLGMAGLNFVGNAVYKDECEGDCNVAQYEFIPWILSQCETVADVRAMLSGMTLLSTPFKKELPVAELHWLIADKDEAITIEYMADGLHIYENKVGVMTNNPPFNMQMMMLNNYKGLSRSDPENRFSDTYTLQSYSRGMGGIGLPGDLSSASRFAKIAFTRANSLSGDSEEESVNQFFHIIHSVEQQRGCCEVGPGKYEITLYSSCCNTQKGIYYYTTYGNHQIQAVDMHRVDLDGTGLYRYPTVQTEQICLQN
ncbi:MAG: choloylglycine hydrolase family protein [Eubacterium sp.]|nr:choloylglycine hydrolase family protein [Eubacterium sp.]